MFIKKEHLTEEERLKIRSLIGKIKNNSVIFFIGKLKNNSVIFL
jgi:hypothetical protein